MLADVLVLETCISAFAGTCLLSLSSRTGAPLWVGVGLLIWAFLTLSFLLMTMMIGHHAKNKRLSMWETAQQYGLLQKQSVSDDVESV